MKRLTPAAVTLLTVGVVGLLVTAHFAKGVLAEAPKPIRVEMPKAPVVEFREVPMALALLAPGTQVTAAHLGSGRVRADRIEPETLLSERAVVGRFVKEPIEAGSPIRSSQLYQPGERPPLEVSPGMRAVSLFFSDRGSVVGGLLRKGEHVDVYLTPRMDDANDPRFHGGLTITLLSGVRVLAVGETNQTGVADSADRDPSRDTVTLELSPEQANLLVLAREKGDIALGYNPDGKGKRAVTVMHPDRATMEELLGQGPSETPAATAPVTPRPFTAEAYNGSARTTLQFEAPAPASAPATDGNQP